MAASWGSNTAAVRLTCMEENTTGNFQLKLTEQRREAGFGVAPRLGEETMGIPFHGLWKANARRLFSFADTMSPLSGG